MAEWFCPEETEMDDWYSAEPTWWALKGVYDKYQDLKNQPDEDASRSFVGSVSGPVYRDDAGRPYHRVTGRMYLDDRGSKDWK